MRIVVGQGSCGLAAGASKVYEVLLNSKNENDSCSVEITGGIGMC